MMRRLVALAACAVALAACRVDATVTVRMRENGSGAVIVRVELDRAAVRAAEIGDGKLEDRVRLDDLPAAGWTVVPWRRHPDGGATLVVRKPFSRPAQVAALVAELNGASGPLRGFRASRTSSTFSTAWKVHGTVDLRTIELGMAQDPELIANLTAERVDVGAVESRVEGGLLGLRVRAVAALPGGERTVVVAKAGTAKTLSATADETDTGRVALLAAGIGLGAVAVLILIVGERRTRRHRRPAPVRSGS